MDTQEGLNIMDELPAQFRNHNKLKWFEVTPKRLLQIRKWLMIVSVLFVVTSVVDLYTAGRFTLNVALDFIAAMALFSFSTKAETLYLKLKIEERLNNEKEI
jgi:hypothetical protein